MTLLGNFVEMSGQEENDPLIENKRSKKKHKRRGINFLIKKKMTFELLLMLFMSFITHPREDFFSLSTCPDKISQQSHSYTQMDY